jgi:hypothetical protein
MDTFPYRLFLRKHITPSTISPDHIPPYNILGFGKICFRRNVFSVCREMVRGEMWYGEMICGKMQIRGVVRLPLGWYFYKNRNLVSFLKHNRDVFQVVLVPWVIEFLKFNDQKISAVQLNQWVLSPRLSLDLRVVYFSKRKSQKKIKKSSVNIW